MVFMALLADNMSIVIMSHCARIFQAGIVHFAHDIPHENLSYNHLKYQASMVAYVCFETAATGVAVNGNLHGDTMNKSVAEMPPTRY